MGTRKLETYQISGHSMYPFLRDGQKVEVQAQANYEIGDVVLARHPLQTDIIVVKRIVSRKGRRLRLRGDNSAESTDKFGLISEEKIIAKVISNLD